MGLPSKRRTKTSKKDRASHFALKAQTFGKCSECGQPILPHRACAKCGTFKGKAVLKIKTSKKAAKSAAKPEKKAAKKVAKAKK